MLLLSVKDFLLTVGLRTGTDATVPGRAQHSFEAAKTALGLIVRHYFHSVSGLHKCSCHGHNSDTVRRRHGRVRNARLTMYEYDWRWYSGGFVCCAERKLINSMLGR